jgi:DNA-binding NarL/FixJ family response regulator
MTAQGQAVPAIAETHFPNRLCQFIWRNWAFANVERGPFVRDIAAEGKVVAAVSPTLYATYGGAVTMQVHAGDSVRKGQLLARIESPELTNKLAQEQSKGDAMQVDYLQAQVDARTKSAELKKAYDNAQIDEKSAETNLSREQKAFAAGASTGVAVDQAKDTLEKSRIALAHAKGDIGLSDDSMKFNIQAKKLAHENQLQLFGQHIEVRLRLAHAQLAQGRSAQAVTVLMPLLQTAQGDQECAPLMAGVQVLSELSCLGTAAPAALRDRLAQWQHRAQSLQSSVLPTVDLPAPSPAGDKLSERELEVLKRIAAGDSNKLIARAFDLSPHTVKRHVANVLDKLGLSSRGQAAAWYREHG